MMRTPTAFTSSPLRGRSRGVSLIEILVGIAIGLIGLLAIFQSVAVWNKHTQTTSAGGDAQTAGTLAMFALERDLKLAGLGFGKADAPTMGCVVQANDSQFGRAFPFAMVPVQIVPGVASDVINVLYGSSSFFTDVGSFTFSTSTTKKLKRRNGFKPGDLAVVAGDASASAASATCRLVEITDTANVDGFTVAHDAAAFQSFYAASGVQGQSRFNPAPAASVPFSSGQIFNLGPTPAQSVWQVTNSHLTRTENILPAAALPVPLEITENVVAMRAQYGVDLDGNGRIADSCPPGGEWTSVDPVDWTRVLAIRVSLLVRSRQFELNGDAGAGVPRAVTVIPPAWACGNFTMTNVDGTQDNFGPNNADPNNWRYYRYRVYERVIPLRNMLWGTLP